MVFLFGAGIGFVGAIMLKNVILAICPDSILQHDAVQLVFDWYFFIALVIAFLAGKYLRHHERQLFKVGTAIVGAWGIALTLIPLLVLWGVTVPAWSSLATF